MSKYPSLKRVQVPYEGGDMITTSMSGSLTNAEIKNYFRVGRKFNIGIEKDEIRAVKKVKILK